MLSFHAVGMEDQERISKANAQSGFFGCEYCFGNNLAWAREYDTRVAYVQDFAVMCSHKMELPSFAFPAGKGDYKALFQEMKQYADSLGVPLRVRGIPVELVPNLEQWFPGKFQVETYREEADYLYLTEEFANFSGKKFHQKRNFVNRFLNYNPEFREITPNDFEQCIAFGAKSYNAKAGYTDASAVAEQYAIHMLFQNYEKLRLMGGMLFVGEELVAFSVGERLNSSTVDVHLEKADTNYVGAYPAMAQAFAKFVAKDFLYLNREEDLGIEGLRKSKLSYHPVKILEKYTATAVE